MDPASSYLSLEIPEDRLLVAIAEEASLRDRDLDQIEAELDVEPDPARAAALAMTLARSGRSSSRSAIERTGRRHQDRAMRLALDLLELSPRRTERADSGYRFTDLDGHTLYVEDPIAAHWHAMDRWGPPIRPEPSLAPVVAGASASIDLLERTAAEGGIVLVSFAPARFEAAHPALRLLRAGFARTPGLDDVVRWRDVASFGVLEARQTRAIACERTDGTRLTLGHRPSLGEARLLELIGRLLRSARS